MYILAGHLGKTIEEIESMPAKHVFNFQWMYSSLPWGVEVDDQRHGQLIGTLLNVARSNGATIKTPEFSTLKANNLIENIAKIQKEMMVQTSEKKTPWIEENYKEQLSQSQTIFANLQKRFGGK